MVLPPGATNTTDEPDGKKAARKCSISGSPSCILLRDRFLDIQADMLDKIKELEEEVAKLAQECKETKENFEAQISDMETRLKGAQTDLADATETQNQAEEQTRCRESIRNLKAEVCGLKKIRQELLKIKSQ